MYTCEDYTDSEESTPVRTAKRLRIDTMAEKYSSTSSRLRPVGDIFRSTGVFPADCAGHSKSSG